MFTDFKFLMFLVLFSNKSTFQLKKTTLLKKVVIIEEELQGIYGDGMEA